MIVRTDFPDHYKTRMLVDLTGDRGAPVMILRLWGHCQNSRKSRFKNLLPVTLKAICRADELDADRLHSILVQTGFIDIEGDETVVHDWDEVNGSLIRNWTNGAKSKGRPKKSPGQLPDQGEDGGPGAASTDQGAGQAAPPTDKRLPKNPNKTPGLSGVNPKETDRWIEGLEGLEEEDKSSLSASADDAREDGGPGAASTDQGAGQAAPPTDKRGSLLQIVDLFHSHCPTLPKVRKVEGARLKSVRARWRAAGKDPLAWFAELFRVAGESSRIREGTWCSFDWLMSPKNSQKVLEGNYANSRETAAKKRHFIN